MRKTSLLIGTAFLFLTGCHPKSCVLEPKICYFPTERQFQISPSAFDGLSKEELSQEWGKEMHIAINFARELDLYRAITSFKRSKFLLPPHEIDRRHQLEFYIIQSYYLGKKYCEAINSFEMSHLSSVSTDFPPFRELLIILHDSYLKTEDCENAAKILSLMEKGDPETARDLKLYQVIDEGNIKCISPLSTDHPNKEALNDFVHTYCCCSKSVRTAQTLNAILPGAGYYYVGQKKSALTSFLINTSFIAATVYFFQEGNYGAGFFTASLEFGWYIGGINGAGLAAKQWNEHLYECHGKELMIQEKIFPVLMFESSF